jgi:hypothetical protein
MMELSQRRDSPSALVMIMYGRDNESTCNITVRDHIRIIMSIAPFGLYEWG